jgi:cell fate (sporulation/competence/biofilm development) regulator YlbF (YheA/YmcA/DUF963 family)
VYVLAPAASKTADGREKQSFINNALMSHTVTDEIIHQKTIELCDTIVRQPTFQAIRQRVDSFMGNEEAQNQYQQVVEKGQSLQQKQQTGTPLSDDEIQDFEKSREQLISNPVAREFLDAQQEMRAMQESVSRYVHKTFEIGRVPAPEDFESCGHGCSCH